MEWLRKFTRPTGMRAEPETKSRVLQADMFAAIGDDKNIAKSELATVPYKGIISNKIASAIFASSPVVRRAADLVADQAMMAPMTLYRRRSLTSSLWQEEYDKYPAEMLLFINSMMTPCEFVGSLVRMLMLYENAFVAMEPTPASHSAISPMSLYPMLPEFTTLVPDAEKGVNYYVYKVPGAKPVVFEEKNVAHISGFSPFDRYYGLGRLNALEQDIRKERNAKRYLGRFYSSAAAISGILETEFEGEEEIIKYRRQIEENYRGGDKAWRVMVLEKGMKYTPVVSSQIEVNSMPVVKDTYEMTAMVFGVPAGLLFELAGANVKELETALWRLTVMPLLLRIEQSLTKHICHCNRMGLRLRIGFDVREILALKRDMLDIAKMDIAYVNVGIRTPNQIAATHNWELFTGDHAEWGDTPTPVWKAKAAEDLAASKPGGNTAQANGTSPSMTMPGSEGGRDQSETGEAQLIDESGKKLLDTHRVRFKKAKMGKETAEAINKSLAVEIDPSADAKEQETDLLRYSQMPDES